MESASKATNRSARIRELIAAYPEWDNKTIATAAGTTSALVGVVRNTDNRKALGLPSYHVLRRRKQKEKAKAKAKKANKQLPTVETIRAVTEKVNDIVKGTLVDNPPHYTAGGLSTYDFIKAKKLSYELGNVIKYVSRADYKGSKLRDLQKAQWYLNAAIQQEEAR